MAGNIMATIPTTHTTKNEESMPMSGEPNMLAIVAMGMAVGVGPIVVGEEA
jgi:hypothetical protein